MLKKLFFPATFRGHRFYKERILGITLENDVIHCTLVEISSSKTTIVAVAHQPVKIEEGQTLAEATAHALHKAAAPLQEKADAIYWGLSSSASLFKEIKLPFVDHEKIAMVLEYEIESMLPFTLDEAIVDFVVTKTIPEENASQLLVAAVRKHEIQSILDICSQANIKPHRITLDVFGAVAVYKEIAEYKDDAHATAIINLSAKTTRIVFIEEGTIRLIRTLNQGIESIAAKIAEMAQIPVATATEHILVGGIRTESNNVISEAISKAFTELLGEIQFTVDTFSVKTNFSHTVTRCLFTGPYARINGLPALASSILEIPTSLFSPEKLFSPRSHYKSEIPPLQLFDAIESLGITLQDEAFSLFDLRQKEFFSIDYAAGRKQIGAAVSILALFFGMLGLLGYAEINLLSNRLEMLEKKERKRLSPLIAADSKKKPGSMPIKKLLNEAKKGLEQKQEMWAPLTQDALKPLAVLQELNKIIDRKRFDVAVETLTFNRDDDGKVLVEIAGSFKSRTGSDHFAHFAEFEKNFSGSEFLAIVGAPDPVAAEEKGIKFVAHFKQK